MQDLEQLLRELGNNQESTDRTVYIRETPTGEVVDFEIIERTNFANEYPETVKELRTKKPLPCGHQITKENPFGGYCKGEHGFFRKHLCNNEYCANCCLQCPRCGLSVSVACCAKLIDEVLVCKNCAHKLERKHRLHSIWEFITKPFTETLEDEQD